MPWAWWPAKIRVESPDGAGVVWQEGGRWLGAGAGRTRAPAPASGGWETAFGAVDLGLDEVEDVASSWWTEVLVVRGRPLGAVTPGQARFGIGWAAHLAARERWVVEWEVHWTLSATGRSQGHDPRRWVSAEGIPAEATVPAGDVDVLLAARAAPSADSTRQFLHWIEEQPSVSARLVQQALVGLRALPRPGYAYG